MLALKHGRRCSVECVALDRPMSGGWSRRMGIGLHVVFLQIPSICSTFSEPVIGTSRRVSKPI